VKQAVAQLDREVVRIVGPEPGHQPAGDADGASLYFTYRSSPSLDGRPLP
jgi:hypothetical protein